MNTQTMNPDVICIGTALLDSIIRGFDPEPVSASGYRAESGTLIVGGEAVNEATALAKQGTGAGVFGKTPGKHFPLTGANVKKSFPRKHRKKSRWQLRRP